MALDVAALLTPLSEDAPAGENLEYDAEFIELGTAAQRKPDQQYGDVKVPGEEPDWEDVQRRAIGVLERTRDLRPAMYLAQALARNEGYPGFRDALQLIDGYLEHLWGAVHPQLDPDDDNDPTMRVNLLSTLCNVAAVLKPLREAPLARSRVFGIASLQMVAEIEAAAAAPPADGSDDNQPKGPSRADLEAIFMDCPYEELAAIHAAVAECQRLARHLEATLTDLVGASHAVDMDNLNAVLKEAMNAADPWFQRRQAEAGAGAEAAPEAEAAAGEAAPGAVAAPAAAAPVRVVQAGVNSRTDALRAIDDIIKYFRDNEPTSPVPILLTRARRWMSMDFMSILGDIAPDAAREVERLKGSAPE